MKNSAGILLIRVGAFPNTSETFITLQAKLAMDLGYDVRILVDKKNGIPDSSQVEIIERYGLLDRTTELVRIDPPSKWGDSRRWSRAWLEAYLGGYLPP